MVDNLSKKSVLVGIGGKGYSLLQMIAMRLHLNEGETYPFDFMEAHRIDESKVVVFLVNDKQPMMLEDDGHLFPSDLLITKLRLIMKGT